MDKNGWEMSGIGVYDIKFTHKKTVYVFEIIIARKEKDGNKNYAQTLESVCKIKICLLRNSGNLLLNFCDH